MKRLIKYIIHIIQRMRKEHIAAFASQSAFFIIMSFFPLCFLFVTILKITPNGVGRISTILSEAVPYIDKDIIVSVFDSFIYRPVPTISMTTLFTAWSASKSFYAIGEGFHSVLGVRERRNYFFLRLRSLVYSLGFALSLVILFFIGVFGDRINLLVTQNCPQYMQFTYLISGIRKSFIIFVLFVILSLLYIFLPDWNNYMENGGQKLRLKYQLQSALLSSVVIYLYTIIFSFGANIYIHNNIYGGAGAIVTIMLWLYGSMYILILGFRLAVFLSLRKEQKLE